MNYKISTSKNMSDTYTINTKKVASKGTTLFEVLLYIALFTILSTATIYLYISILKTTDTLSSTLQRIEIQIYTRQLAEYQLQTSQMNTPQTVDGQAIDIQMLQVAMQRILRWYPNLRLIDIGVEHLVEQTNASVKITYRLEQKNNNKTFSHAIYIN